MSRRILTPLGARSLVVALLIALIAAGCSNESDTSATAEEPAQLEEVKGSDLKRVVLTERAAKRIGIETTLVRDGAVDASGKRQGVIPIAAVLYDPNGATWTYTSPKIRTFLRHRIRIGEIRGDDVLLAEGPPAGTAVVTVGAVELYGTESEIGH